MQPASQRASTQGARKCESVSFEWRTEKRLRRKIRPRFVRVVSWWSKVKMAKMARLVCVCEREKKTSETVNKKMEDGKNEGDKSAWKFWLKKVRKKKEKSRERKRRKEKGETDWEGNCYLFIVPSPTTETLWRIGPMVQWSMVNGQWSMVQWSNGPIKWYSHNGIYLIDWIEMYGLDRLDGWAMGPLSSLCLYLSVCLFPFTFFILFFACTISTARNNNLLFLYLSNNSRSMSMSMPTSLCFLFFVFLFLIFFVEKEWGMDGWEWWMMNEWLYSQLIASNTVAPSNLFQERTSERTKEKSDMLEKELSTPWLTPSVVFFGLWWSLDKSAIYWLSSRLACSPRWMSCSNERQRVREWPRETEKHRQTLVSVIENIICCLFNVLWGASLVRYVVSWSLHFHFRCHPPQSSVLGVCPIESEVGCFLSCMNLGIHDVCLMTVFVGFQSKLNHRQKKSDIHRASTLSESAPIPHGSLSMFVFLCFSFHTHQSIVSIMYPSTGTGTEGTRSEHTHKHNTTIINIKEQQQSLNSWRTGRRAQWMRLCVSVSSAYENGPVLFLLSPPALPSHGPFFFFASLLLSTGIHPIYLLEKKTESHSLGSEGTKHALSNRRRKKYVLILISQGYNQSHVLWICSISSAGSMSKR